VTVRENFDDDDAEGTSWPGDPTWSGQAWTEIGENNGAEDGDVAVADFLGGSRTGLRLQNANKGLQGSVNLSNVSLATLSLGFRRKSLDDATDYVSVQVSGNGGAAWTELARIAGPANDDDLQVISYDISAYASSATALRLLSSASLGSKDKVYIDFVEIVYEQNGTAPPAPPTPTGDFTVRDQFNLTAYNNNDGAVPWLGDWVEAGDDGRPGSGDITIEANGCPNGGLCLVIDANGNHSISRAADLSSAASATLSYAYTWERDEDGVVVLEASADGSTWAILSEYTSSASGGEQFDLTPFLSGSTHIRFRVTQSDDDDGYFRVDDVEIATASGSGGSAAGLSGIVRDEFGAVSYSNNNGTQNWNTGWAESGDGSPSPSAGYVRVSSGALYLKYTNRALSRQTNLVGATSATLSLKFKRSGLDGSSDYVAVQVSADGGATWTEIDRFAGPSNDASYQTRSYDIAAYARANTAIRFATSSSLGSSDIVYFDDVQIEHTCAECIDTSNLASTYLKAIGADQVWNGSGHFKGQGVGVAVVDSGVARHSDLSDSGSDSESRVIGKGNFSSNPTVLDDANGHGSHVAGVIAGNGAQSDGAHIGVAPEADLVDVQVADDQGMSSMSDVILGLQWILEHKAEYNIRVINLSLNSTVAESYHTNPLNAAVEILWFNGIVVVVSAGNNGTATLYPPANDPFVIVVGATDDKGTWSISDDVVASFSAYGVTADGFAKPDLVAPGRNIVSLLASDDSNFALSHPSNAVPGAGGISYFRMSGTSAAAPMVSGAVALLLQAHPHLTPDQVKYRLMATANKTWPGYDAAKAGAGYLNILAAVFSNTTESANTGLPVSQLLTTGSDPINSSVNWNSVNWNSVNWNSVNWNSVNWNSVNWNSVNWNSDYWEP
jgi:serine protease AprX